MCSAGVRIFDGQSDKSDHFDQSDQSDQSDPVVSSKHIQDVVMAAVVWLF